MRLLFTFVLLFLCLRSFTGASFSLVDSSTPTKPVTSLDQLWRFQVGRGKTLTLGDRYLCFAGQSRRFFYSRGSSLYLGSSTCYSSSRFEVEFVEGNQIRLKSYATQKYISCTNSGEVLFTDWETPATIFELSISDDENQVLFYNPEVMGTLSADGYELDCSGYRSGSSSQFYGWKRGPREAWEASEEWQMIGSFDNRYSDSATKFVYETAVGVEGYSTTEARVPHMYQVEAGPDAFKTFTESIGDSEVAWSSTPPNVWQKSTRLSQSIEVAPRTLTKLYQAIGHYGIFTIRSLYFQARDEKTRAVDAQ